METTCGKAPGMEERAALLRKAPSPLRFVGARSCRLPIKAVIALGLFSAVAVLVASPLLSTRRRQLVQLRKDTDGDPSRSILQANSVSDSRTQSRLGYVELEASELAEHGCKTYGCGESFDESHNCQCNAECIEHGSCCSDYVDVCTSDGKQRMSPGQCRQFGCAEFRPTQACQCDAACEKYENCCEDFQSVCKKDAASTLTCKEYGCQAFNPHHRCQCNAECMEHSSCCEDFEGECKAFWGTASSAPAMVRSTTTVTTTLGGEACELEYNGGNRTMCFCQLAGNRGCTGTPCDCPQGCTGIVWPFQHCVSFRNLKEAYGCPNPVALLTIPKSYFKTIQSLRDYCPRHMSNLLVEMLRAGFDSYQAYVNPGPVKQCIHAGFIVSQAWLHVHTICAEGSVDGMTGTNAFAWCGTMRNPEEAHGLATQIVKWASKGKPMPESAPTTCAEIGCGNEPPSPICSCKADCHQKDSCCTDMGNLCPHEKLAASTTATSKGSTTPTPGKQPTTTTGVPESEIAIR